MSKQLGDFGLVTKQRAPDVDESQCGETESSVTSGAENCVVVHGSSSSSSSSSDVVGGTLSYAAPELLLAVRPTTSAVDMWAAGCLLGEMITGRVLFHATTVIQQVRRLTLRTRYPF